VITVCLQIVLTYTWWWCGFSTFTELIWQGPVCADLRDMDRDLSGISVAECDNKQRQRKVFWIGTVHYNWPTSVHASLTGLQHSTLYRFGRFAKMDIYGEQMLSILHRFHWIWLECALYALCFCLQLHTHTLSKLCWS